MRTPLCGIICVTAACELSTFGSSKGHTNATTGIETSMTIDTTAVTEPTDCKPTQWYKDGDGDAVGVAEISFWACEAPAHYVDQAGDCDDTNISVSPLLPELCDGIDNDCDEGIDEYSAKNTGSCAGCSKLVYQDHAYYLCETPKNWAAARATCLKFGGDLAIIEQLDENTAIYLAIVNHPASDDQWHIGMSDSASEMTWLWVDGTEVDPGGTKNPRWNNTQPDDADGKEDCGVLGYADDATWNDVPCGDLHLFVCEGPTA